MNQTNSMLRRLLDFLLQEPLLPFAVIGGVLFALYGFNQPTAKERIEITQQTLQALEDLDVEMRGRPLTEQERQSLIESHIEDEILLREAFRQELEKRDSRVRKRLLTVMRASLDEVVAEPTQTQLEAYYQQELPRFESGDAYTFEQVFFSFGAEPANADSLLNNLNKGADAEQLGDQHFFGPTVRQATVQQIRQSFGREFADNFLVQQSQQDQEWWGPLESRDGTHFIRVIRKDVIPKPSFEQLESYLKQDWMFKKRREIQSGKIAQLKQQYDIVLPGQDH